MTYNEPLLIKPPLRWTKRGPNNESILKERLKYTEKKTFKLGCEG